MENPDPNLNQISVKDIVKKVRSKEIFEIMLLGCEGKYGVKWWYEGGLCLKPFGAKTRATVRDILPGGGRTIGNMEYLGFYVIVEEKFTDPELVKLISRINNETTWLNLEDATVSQKIEVK